MAHLIGGDADKKGNFYENMVVVSKFVDMLSGHFKYVQQETYIKDAETGVDILVEDNQGLTTFFQCKSRNGINDSWSISNLINSGIIKKAFSHTRKGVQFTLVSPLTQSHTLLDFCRRAKTFNDLSAFELNALGGANPQKEYEKIKDELLKQKDVADEDIFSFFNLFSFEYIPDDQQLIKRRLEVKGQILNSDLAYGLLTSYVETQQKIGRKIYYLDIVNYLKRNNVNFFTIDYEVDGKKIFNMQNEFKESLDRSLIKGVDYKRSETTETLNTIKNNKFTVLTGIAGSGKSIVSKQVCNLLDDESIVYLPININAHDIKKTYNHFSQMLGLNKGIVRTLSMLNPDKTTIIILDQLDSIGWNSQVSSNGKNLCYNFVKESLLYDNIHILFVARNVEVKNIQRMVDYEQKKYNKEFLTHEVVVNKLNLEDIKKIVPELSLGPEVNGLFSTIGNIKLFLSLKEEEGRGIVNTYDLIDAFIESKNKEISMKFPSFDTKSFCTKLANKMTVSGSYSVVKNSLNNYSKENIKELLKVGVITNFGNDRIGFIHQIIYDFIIAQKNYRDFESGKSIVHILRRYNDNFLEKFETMKQFMEMLFNSDTSKSYEYMDMILFSNCLVYSIKRLALNFVNTFQPITHEHITLVHKIITSKKFGIKYVRDLSYEKKEIVEYLITKGYIQTMLKNRETQDSAISILLSVQDSELSFNLVQSMLEHTEQVNLIERTVHQIDDLKSSDSFFNLKITLIDRGLIKSPYINLDALLNKNVDRTYKYLNIIFSQKRDLKIRFDITSKKNEKELKPLFDKYGTELHSLLKSYLYADESFKYKLMIFDFNSAHFHDNDDIAIGLFIDSIQYQTDDVILSYLNCIESNVFLKKATLINLNRLDISKAINIFEKMIDNEFLLHQNYYGHTDLLLYFEKVIKKLSGYLDVKYFNSLLEQILSYKRPDFIEHVKYILSHRKTYNVWTNYWGEEQMRFLNCLPNNKLDKRSKELRATLNRRFIKDELYSDEFRGGVRTYSVVSGLNKKNKPFTRKTWIKILTSTKSGKNGDKSRRDKFDRNGNLLSTDSHQFNRLISDAAYENRELFVDILLNSKNVRPDYVFIILDAISSRYSNKECKIESSPAKILEAHKLYFDLNKIESVRALINFAQNYEIEDEWLLNILITISKQFKNEEKLNSEEKKFDSSWQGHFTAPQSGSVLALSKYISFKKQKAVWFDDLYTICVNSNDLRVVISGVDLVYALCTFDLESGVQLYMKLLENHPLILEYNLSLLLIDYSISKHNLRYMHIFDSKWNEFTIKGKSSLKERLLAYYCFYGINKKRVIKIIKAQNKKSDGNDRFTYTLSDIVENNLSNQIILNRTLLLIKTLVKNRNRNTGDLLFLAKKNIKFYHDNGMVTKIIKNYVDRDDFDMRLFYLDDIFNEMPNLIDFNDVIFEISSAIVKKNMNYRYDIDKVVNWLKNLYWESTDDRIRKKALRYIDKIQMIYGRII